MVHGANNSEPCSLQRGYGAQFLGTKFFGVESFPSSHIHGTLNWEEYTAMCMEKKKNGVYTIFYASVKHGGNSAEICLRGPSFTS